MNNIELDDWSELENLSILEEEWEKEAELLGITREEIEAEFDMNPDETTKVKRRNK